MSQQIPFFVNLPLLIIPILLLIFSKGRLSIIIVNYHQECVMYTCISNVLLHNVKFTLLHVCILESDWNISWDNRQPAG